MPKDEALLNALAIMPDDFGEILRPPIHPSSAHLPTCYRRFLLAVRLGWRVPEWREALSIGDVYHKVMAQIGQKVDPAVACEAVRVGELHRLGDLLVAFVECYPGVKPPDQRPQKKAISLGAVLATAYDTFYPVPDDWTVLAVEKNFIMPLEPVGLPGYVDATLDLVIADKNDDIWILDYKSVTGVPYHRALMLPFDIQSKLYRAVWDYNNPKQRAKGMIHGIIAKPAIRQKKTETWDEYADRYFEWFDTQRLLNPERPPVIQSYVPFGHRTLARDEEVLGILRTLSHLHTCYPSRSTFPRVGNAYSGCFTQGRTCPYIEICRAQGPRQWGAIARRLGYIKNTETRND